MSIFATVGIIAAVAAGVIGFIAAWRVRSAREKMQRYNQLQQGQLMNYDNPNYLPYHERHYAQQAEPYQAEIVGSQPIQTSAGTTTEASIIGLANIIKGIIDRRRAREAAAAAECQIVEPSPVPQPAPMPMPMPAPAPAPQPMPTTPGIPMNGWDWEAQNDAALKRRLAMPPMSSGFVQGAINAHGLNYPVQALYNRGYLDQYNHGNTLLSAYNNVCSGYDPRPDPWNGQLMYPPKYQYEPYPSIPFRQTDMHFGYGNVGQPGVVPAPFTAVPTMPRPIIRNENDYYDYINDMELKRRLVGRVPEFSQPVQPMAYPQQPVQQIGYQQPGQFVPQYGFQQPVQQTSGNLRWMERPYDPSMINAPYGGFLCRTKAIADPSEWNHFAETMAKMEAARVEENRRQREIRDAQLLANARPGERIVLSNGQVVYPYG